MDTINYINEKFNNVKSQYENCDFIWPVIPILGTYLDRNGFTFEYIKLFHREKERLTDLLQNNKVLSISITTTIYVTPDPIIEIVRFIRSIDNNVKIIIGGPYISNIVKGLEGSQLDSLFFLLGGDIFIYDSEGEMTLVEVLKKIKYGHCELYGVNNVAFRNDFVVVKNPHVAEDNCLESNIPDYSLFPSEDFGAFASVRTSKSCPFKCAFCNFPEHSGKYKYLGLEHVEKLFEELSRHKEVTNVTFIDDTFNVPFKRFKQVVNLLKSEKYNFKWNSYYRSDYSDEETIKAMAESGCEGVFLGIESGSDYILDKMNKKSTKKHYYDAIQLFRKYGIVTYASFIIGFPGETEETIRETVNFIKEAKPDFFRAQMFYLDHKTPIWKKRDLDNLEGEGFNWKHATMTSERATDIIDKSFFDIEESIWLPQQGFEFWSIFYLKKYGYSIESIKFILIEYNKLVRKSQIQGALQKSDLIALSNY